MNKTTGYIDADYKLNKSYDFEEELPFEIEMQVDAETNELLDPDDYDELQPRIIVLPIREDDDEPKVRVVSLYGEMDDVSCEDIMGGLIALKQFGSVTKFKNEDDPDSGYTTIKPIEFLISSEGGDVFGMFALLDLMRDIQKTCEIHTYGLGKVMSAAVLLLAAGAKGHRKVGRNTRLMLHPMTSGAYGTVTEMKVEQKEIKAFQKQYIEAIVELTNLDEKQARKLVVHKGDTYFDAKQALAWGICDEIV